MNININKIYTQNYYNLKRYVEENTFIDNLNNTSVRSLILPALKKLADNLYLQISGIEKFQMTIPEVIENETEINKRIAETLSSHNLFQIINDKSISTLLFTNALIKLDKRLFGKDGINDETFILQSYVYYWLEANFARIIAQDKRFESYDSKRKVLEQTELLHHFYTFFKDEIPNKWVQEEEDRLIENIKEPTSILDSIRTFDKDYFKGYEFNLKNYKDYSPWKFIVEATQFSDYAMFNEEYSFRNSILFESNISLWLKFWDNLKWPVLQDIPFLYNENPRDILNISKELVKQKPVLATEPKHLAFILLKNLFEGTLKVQKNLSFYLDTERISSLSDYERDEQILKKGIEIHYSWEQEKVTIYNEIIQILLEIITLEEMSEWVFSYVPHSSIRSEYDTIYNKEIETLISVFNPYILKDSFENQIQNASTNFNLRKFEFLASQINTNQVYAEELIDLLSDYIVTEKFYWDNSFSLTYWPTLKSIGMLLSLTSDPIAKSKNLIQTFKVIHEGWNITTIDYRSTQRESFIYCGVILLLEHNQIFKTKEMRTSFFDYLLNLLIFQTRFSVRNTNFYSVPLYLLGLVANQIYPDLKLKYELTLINEVDDLNSVIDILSNDNNKLSAKSKAKLSKRINIEFNFHKRQLMQKGQTLEIEKLETNIKKLDILL